MEGMKNNTGICCPAILTLLFITLKLCKVINWSWLWIMSPLWIQMILMAIATVLYLGIHDEDEEIDF